MGQFAKTNCKRMSLMYFKTGQETKVLFETGQKSKCSLKEDRNHKVV